MWTSDQKNTKPKNRQQTPFDEHPSSSRIRINGLGSVSAPVSQERDIEYSQSKFKQNPSTNTKNLSHVFGNLHLSDQPSIHQSSVEPMRRISTQSHNSVASFQNAHHQNIQNSHGNYVDIDAIDSILSESENFHHYAGAPQYELNPNEARIQSLMDVGVASPIYENQTSLINRSESPIYSNTHDPSVSSLYPQPQNIYSNVPAITAGPSTYANIQPAHHAIQPSKFLIYFKKFCNSN